MPELPDIVVYLEALEAVVAAGGTAVLREVRLHSPFVLRTVQPPIDAIRGLGVRRWSRLGKRIVFEFDGELFLVLHLMIAGRLRWRPGAAKPPARKLIVAEFVFDGGRLYFTEAGSKKRASLHLVQGRAALAAMDPGGVDPLTATPEAFRAALLRESHTLKRALTDPHLLSGIGNAYSDEILHAARLSPLQLARNLSDAEWARLVEATRGTLTAWTARLRADAAGAFPEHVTAFREGMAVHGRFKQPCPVCGSPVQRIVYATNECNYCATCQTAGRLLADRALSRLLREAWPKTLE